VKDEKHREVLGSTTFKVQELSRTDEGPARARGHAVAGWLRPDDVKARITVAHLFGEPASNRRVEGELSLTPVLPRFTRYQEHRFQIGEVIKEPYHQSLAALTTDDKGRAEFNLDLKRFVGRAYRLNLLGRAFEAQGGRNVAAQDSAIVADAAFLVGVKPDGDLRFVQRASARQAQWLAVNQQLNPVAADKLTLEWAQRKFVSVLTQQGNGTFKYVSRLKTLVRNSRSVRIAAGGSSFPLPTDEPGDFDRCSATAPARCSTCSVTAWRGRRTSRGHSIATPSCRFNSTKPPTPAVTRSRSASAPRMWAPG
jgi:uncharacterized protein YfaS (alpha-2-macroglobulin family)